MSLLGDLYTRAKKKITDTVAPLEQKAVSGFGALYNGAKSRLSGAENNIKGYFNNDATTGGIVKNTFAPSNLSKALMDAPEYHFADKVSWNTPVRKVGATLGQGVLNTFHHVRDYSKEAADQTYGNTPRDTRKLISLGGKAALDLAGLGLGGSKVASMAKGSVAAPAVKDLTGLGKVAWEGAKTAGKPSAAFGGAYSFLDSLGRHDTPLETAKNTAIGTVAGGTIGAVTGGTVAGAVPAVKLARQEGRNIASDVDSLLHPTSKKIVNPENFILGDGEHPPLTPHTINRETTKLPYVGTNKALDKYGRPENRTVHIDTVKPPFDPKSSIFQYMQHPKAGMSIEDVSRGKKKVPTIEDFAANGGKVPEPAPKLSFEEQARLNGMKQSDLNDMKPDAFTDPELSAQYDNFQGLFKNPKLRNPAVKEALVNGDLETLRRELVGRGVMASDQVDNLLYHGEHSGDEVLQMFKDQLMQNDPGLMSGRRIASNLGLEAPKPISIDAFVANGGKAPVVPSPRKLAIVNKDLQTMAPGRENAPILPEKKVLPTAKDFPQSLIDEQNAVLQQGNAGEKWTGGERYIMAPRKVKVTGGQGTERSVPVLDTAAATRATKTGNIVNVADHGGVHVPKEIEDAVQYAIANAKDKSLLNYNNTTPVRIMEDIFGSHAEKVKKYITGTVAKNEDARLTWQDTQKKELSQMFSDLGIKLGSKEDALTQRFAEKKITLPDLQKALPDTWENIVKASELSRMKYDQYLDLINAQMRRFGYPEVPKRQDYITHTNEIALADSLFGGLTNISKEKLPAAMAMIHTMTKPGRTWFQFGQPRRADGNYMESVINALEAYVPAAGKQIFHTDSIQKVRGFEKVLQAQFEKDPQSQTLSNFGKWMSDYANHVSGKTSGIDRGLEALTGRQLPAALDWLRRRSGANMVGANLSSALTNVIPLTQSFATTQKPAAIRGLVEAFVAPFQRNNSVGGVKSSFLTRRFSGNEKISRSWGNKVIEGAGTPFWMIDRFTSNAVVGGKFYEGLAKGLSKGQAMAAADEYAAKVIGDRSFAQMPSLYNSKTAGLITQFQLEVNNQLQFLGKDLPKIADGSKLKMASMLGQVALYSYFYNEVFQKLTGRRPALDPIGLTVQTISDFQDEKKDRWKNMTNRILGSLPYTSAFTEGGRIPAFSIIPNPYNVLTGASTVGQEAKKLFYMLPPTGGGQLRKTIEGTDAYNQGYSENQSGGVRFPIEHNMPNLLRSVFFGQYSTPEAVNYFKEGMKALSADQSEKYKLLGADKGYYDQVQNERKVNQDVEKLKTGKDVVETANAAGVPDTLPDDVVKLANGKYYSKKMDYTYDTPEKAKKAITLRDFRDSDEKTMEYDGKFYYKDDSSETGYRSKTISARSKDLEKASANLEMDRAFANDDLKAWATAADKKINAINKYVETLDPAIDQDEIDSLTLEKENLLDKAEKFSEYGGFKKPKSTKAKDKAFRTDRAQTEALSMKVRNKLDSGLNSAKASNIPTLKSMFQGSGRRVTRRKKSLIRL